LITHAGPLRSPAADAQKFSRLLIDEAGNFS
jgi:hypothetical protein